MKIALQALQAVTVEFFGVVLVVWMLFGFASWGLASVRGNEPQLNHTLADAFDAMKTRAMTVLPSPAPDPERSAFVAQRLDHYSHILGTASKNLLADTIQIP
jgi:hypothetical protein